MIMPNLKINEPQMLKTPNDTILNIQNLQVAVGEKTILKELNLNIKASEVHAIMGPNGSGKSTLANVLARKEGYEIQKGSIDFLNHNLLDLSAEECACLGLFLGFQYPVAIPGVSNIHFLKSSLNAIRKARGLPMVDAVDFLKLVKAKLAELKMPEELLYRPVNDGFSGGEKKRNEILQMSLLEPRLAILDETDSGLDIDALKLVAEGINSQRGSNRAIVLITHYQRLLDYIEPDYIHVLSEGKMILSGDKTLAHTLESKGYCWLGESE